MSREQWGHGYHAGVRSGAKKPRGYAGIFFLQQLSEDNFRQGVVRRRVDEQTVMVTWFSWLCGEANSGSLLPISELQKCRLYCSAEELREGYWRIGRQTTSDYEAQERLYRILDGPRTRRRCG